MTSSDRAKDGGKSEEKLRNILKESDNDPKSDKSVVDDTVSPATRALLSRDKKKTEKPPPPPIKSAPKLDEKEKSARKSISLTSLIKGKQINLFLPHKVLQNGIVRKTFTLVAFFLGRST